MSVWRVHWLVGALVRVETLMDASEVKALLKLAPTEMNKPEYAVVSLHLARKKSLQESLTVT